MVKKYYPGESKEERKARKLREKTTGKKEHKPIPKATIVQEPVKAPVQATPSTSLTPQQQTKPRITRPSQFGMDDFIKHRLEIGTLRK